MTIGLFIVKLPAQPSCFPYSLHPASFISKRETPFPSLIQQCAPAVWQKTCFAANFAAAASICTSSKHCHPTHPSCRLPSRQ